MSDLKMNDKLNAVWDAMIEKVEGTPGIWDRPWFMTEKGESIRPSNFSTGRTYNGFNVINLEISRIAGGFVSSKWLTFNQCKALGGFVNKGSRGSFIIVYSPPKYSEEEKDGKKTLERPPYFSSGYVFNLDQTSLQETPAPVEAPVNGLMTIEAIEEIIKKTGARIIEAPGNKAYYSPGLDQIVLPSISQFKTIEGYYGTKFHELIHWSGAPARLNRLEKNAYFGTESYSREELCAEIGSVFMKTETGINDGIDNAARYIKNWWGNIKEDRGSLIDAGGKAQKASNYLLNGAPKKEA